MTAPARPGPRRVKLGGKKFRRAVEAEIERRRLATPITLRTLTVDFVNRRFILDGHAVTVTTNAVAFPILSTEHPIFPDPRIWDPAPGPERG